jgi:putative spermidine/putrescine transport system permease protein
MTQSRLEAWLLGAWTLAVIVFVMAPLLAVFAVSLTSREYVSLPTDGVSFRWFANIAERPKFVEAALTSIILGLTATLIALCLGTLAALAVVRYRFRARETVRTSLTSPLFIPVILTGLSLLIFASSYGVSNQAVRLFIGHSLLTLPYVFRVVSASVTFFDMNQEYAARNLGASPLESFFLVTLPQIRPGLIAGAVFAFIVSFDDVSMSIFLVGNRYTTLPVELFTYTVNDSDPTAAAIAVLMIIVSAGAVAVVQRVVGLTKLMG